MFGYINERDSCSCKTLNKSIFPTWLKLIFSLYEVICNLVHSPGWGDWRASKWCWSQCLSKKKFYLLLILFYFFEKKKNFFTRALTDTNTLFVLIYFIYLGWQIVVDNSKVYNIWLASNFIDHTGLQWDVWTIIYDGCIQELDIYILPCNLAQRLGSESIQLSLGEQISAEQTGETCLVTRKSGCWKAGCEMQLDIGSFAQIEYFKTARLADWYAKRRNLELIFFLKKFSDLILSDTN